MASAVELGVDSVLEVLTQTFALSGDERGDEFDILCPNPSHNDRNPSCGVNLGTGYWHCYACGTGGDLIDLGRIVLGIPRKEVKALLEPSTPEALLVSVQRKLRHLALPTKVRRKKHLLTLPGPYEPGPLDEMYERGFTPQTMERWGVRYAPEQELIGKKGTTFTIKNSIAIPIRDEKGRLLAWCYRSTRQSPAWQPRYLYTPEVEISELWFGLQHHSDAPDINVVEGAADAMWLDQCGFPAFGMLGSNMGDAKIRRLAKHRSVTMFADRDNAGALWVKRIGGMLGTQMPLWVVLYDRRITKMYETTENKGKIDPQMLVPLDVEILISKKIPWAQYVRKVAASAGV